MWGETAGTEGGYLMSSPAPPCGSRVACMPYGGKSPSIEVLSQKGGQRDRGRTMQRATVLCAVAFLDDKEALSGSLRKPKNPPYVFR